MSEKHLLRLCQAALMAAMAVVLVYFIRFPLFPAAPFLEFDVADVPTLLATLLFGPVWGLAILAVVCVIQAFLLGGNGWVGCVMHFVSSGALILLVGLIYGKSEKIGRLILGMALGVIAVVLLMIPMNLTLTVHFMGAPVEMVKQLMWPAIIPFNLIKASANGVLTILLYRVVHGKLIGVKNK